MIASAIPQGYYQSEASTTAIGIMGTALYAGFMLGCVAGPRVVGMVGHVRAFAGFAALATVSSLAYPLVVEPAVWCVLRGVTGLEGSWCRLPPRPW